jgi:hypothetical protein
MHPNLTVAQEGGQGEIRSAVREGKTCGHNGLGEFANAVIEGGA